MPNTTLTSPPEMAAETKKWIAGKGYPKPETDITELSE